MQENGRFDVFEDYRLRVGEVTANSHPPAGGSVDEKRFDETAIGEGKVCTITEVMPAAKCSLAAQAAALPAHLGLDAGNAGLVDHVVFEGITIPASSCC